MDGQMTLFDFASDEQKEELKVNLPNVEEFPREVYLSYERELMGVYVSGHPLDEYIDILKKNVNAHAIEFVAASGENDESFGNEQDVASLSIKDDTEVVVGGILIKAELKYSGNGNAYGDILLEDLTGTVKILAFAKTYERVRSLLVEGNKVFIKGRVQNDEEREAIIRCEDVKSFDDSKKEIWIQFSNKDEYQNSESKLTEAIRTLDGNDAMVIYLKEEKAVKRLEPKFNVGATEENLAVLRGKFGEENVQIVYKKVEFADRNGQRNRW